MSPGTQRGFTEENVLSTGIYNDLGIQVRDRLLLLIEAQTNFSINIALRVLLYLADTYKRYVEGHKLDLYGSKPVRVPRPELYVIYTGNRKQVPETVLLSDLYEGKGDAEIRVKVLRGGKEGDILSQYVRFCQIADAARRQHGNGPEAIDGMLRQCKEENILMPFLATRQKEVRDIMGLLFDDATIREIHDYNVALEARQEGMERGMEKGREGQKECYLQSPHTHTYTCTQAHIHTHAHRHTHGHTYTHFRLLSCIENILC